MKKIEWRYTLGEILIVIIGISIAFSLNKCSENSKYKTQKIQYLTNLKNDIVADKEQLETNITEIEEKLKLSTELLIHLKKDMPHKMEAANNLFKIAVISNFDTKNSTYKTLINSGDLKLIEDFALKTAIERHYSDYKTMQKAYIRQENIHKVHLGSYLIENANYDNFAKGIFIFENERLLNNIVQTMRGSFDIKLKATKKGIESCEILLEQLNSVL